MTRTARPDRTQESDTSSSNSATGPAASLPTAWWVLAAVGLVAGVCWTWWPAFAEMWQRWGEEPQYSHGYLVPLFAVALLYLRWDRLDQSAVRPSWWGLPVLLAGLGMKWVASRYAYEWFDPLSLLPVLLGLCLLLGGSALLKWTWVSVLFLFFMIPLPYTLELAMQSPLQGLGTRTATWLMQALGLPAFAEGNVIVVDEVRIGVVEACSGLRMLMIFFALSTGLAVLIDRPAWERAVIVLSAVPIAIFANVMRITVTGLLHVQLADKIVFNMSGTEFADKVFHEWAGLLMMPLALIVLGFELWFMSHMIIEEEDRPLSAGLHNY